MAIRSYGKRQVTWKFRQVIRKGLSSTETTVESRLFDLIERLAVQTDGDSIRNTRKHVSEIRLYIFQGTA